MTTARIITGDVREVLPTLPAESVQCVITSPPYFGLRDYGTASWEGGDPECDHTPARQDRTTRERSGLTGSLEYVAAQEPTYRGICGICGAERTDRQLGLEQSPAEYVAGMVAVFREVWRVLRPDGTLWLNLGDSYSAGVRGGHGDKQQSNTGSLGMGPFSVEGVKPKQLLGIPWRVAFALQEDGWWLRSDIIWHKPNPMPESVRDRPTKAHEYLFLLTKSERYYYDAAAIAEPSVRPDDARLATDRNGIHSGIEWVGSTRVFGADPTTRNKRSVWTVATQPFTGWGETSRQVPVAKDDVCGDTKRIASPDCPVHAGRDRQATTAGYDGHANGASSRNPDSGAGPVPSLQGALFPTDQHHASDSAAGSSDSPRPSCSPSATDRSNGTHRTGLGPATTQPYTPCDGTPDRTGDTSASPASAAQHGCMTENSNGMDDSADHPSARTEHHTVDTSSPIPPECTCQFYRIETKKVDHFATFPEALIEPCILAGTSERGACPECGAPWRRVVEREVTGKRHISPKDANPNRNDGPDAPTSRLHSQYFDYQTLTTGWEPTCTHDAAPVPCVVLDPFSGAGTVGVVALRHGRSYIGVELNPEYVEMSRQRIIGDAPLLNVVDATA